MSGLDPLAASGHQRPPHSVLSGEDRVRNFLSVDPNGLTDFDLLPSDRHDRLDQRSISGSAKSATEIAACARFIDESGARQAHEHHVPNNRVSIERQDPP